jgi:hypothetical protein
LYGFFLFLNHGLFSWKHFSFYHIPLNTLLDRAAPQRSEIIEDITSSRIGSAIVNYAEYQIYPAAEVEE